MLRLIALTPALSLLPVNSLTCLARFLIADSCLARYAILGFFLSAGRDLYQTIKQTKKEELQNIYGSRFIDRDTCGNEDQR